MARSCHDRGRTGSVAGVRRRLPARGSLRRDRRSSHSLAATPAPASAAARAPRPTFHVQPQRRAGRGDRRDAGRDRPCSATPTATRSPPTGRRARAARCSATCRRARLRRARRRRPQSDPVTVSSPTDTPAAVALLRAAPRRRLRLPQDPRRHAPVDQRQAARARRRRARTRPSSSTRATTRRTPTAASPRRGIAQLLGLRDRRREPARHRLLGRRVRLLRAAAVARRLRRDRDRRRAAVGRRTARSAWSASRTRASRSCSSPRPGRRTSPRSRRCRCSTTPTTTLVPRRHPQRRLRVRVGEGPPGRRRGPRAARAGGRASGSPTATRRATTNQALRLQTADVQRRDRAQRATDRGAASDALAPDDASSQDRRARCSSPARGRTRRPAATSPTCSTTSRPASREGHAHERRAPATRSARRCSSRWVEFLDFYVAQRIPTIPPATRALAVGAPRRGVRRRRAAPARPLHRPARLRDRARVVRGRAAGARALRQRRRRHTGAPMPAFEHDGRRRGRLPATHRDHLVLRRRRHAHRHGAHRGAGADRYQYDPAAFPRTDRTTAGATTAFASAPTYDWKPLPDGQGARAT